MLHCLTIYKVKVCWTIVENWYSLWKIVWKRRVMRRKHQSQACENKKQMFVVALNANDHIVYDWIIGFDATQHMTFER